MSHVIVVFSTRENAANIRNALTRSGIEVSAVCLTGAKALQYADTWNDGIVVCGYRLQDMTYTTLREELPETFDMLLVASPSKWKGELPDGVIGLPLPVKIYDLVNSVEMLGRSQDRRRKKRRQNIRKWDESQKKVIDKAKAILMERNDMSEAEAHRYLQKNSMDSGTNLYETAQMVLTMMGD